MEKIFERYLGIDTINNIPIDNNRLSYSRNKLL